MALICWRKILQMRGREWRSRQEVQGEMERRGKEEDGRLTAFHVVLLEKYGKNITQKFYIPGCRWSR